MQRLCKAETITGSSGEPPRNAAQRRHGACKETPNSGEGSWCLPVSRPMVVDGASPSSARAWGAFSVFDERRTDFCCRKQWTAPGVVSLLLDEGPLEGLLSLPPVWPNLS